MAYDVKTLKDRAQCLEAKASLEAELDGYQNRDQNLAYQDRREGRAGASATSRLATATDRVKYLTDQLARPDLAAADRRRYEDQLLTANYQKARLQNRTADTGGAAAFLADVDADQIDAQVDLLSGAIAAVQAHHDTLPA
ncbi:hypothetical protein [Hymenobacter psychrotolerans]|uniref:Uncharacterized protein n=1 Tax=Hymenobacter psychrotolerans DSM 18569 TaxID=1121959 RepID=A0A1M6WPT4_9BACT|nr:hypothetical protein [Hymenobacter psychrotolerans]SHK95624.1 hypothetical protein SAMN02746009_01860 [Hymenobacter psychrotolerans DSM 18569]